MTDIHFCVNENRQRKTDAITRHYQPYVQPVCDKYVYTLGCGYPKYNSMTGNRIEYPTPTCQNYIFTNPLVLHPPHDEAYYPVSHLPLNLGYKQKAPYDFVHTEARGVGLRYQQDPFGRTVIDTFLSPPY